MKIINADYKDENLEANLIFWFLIKVFFWAMTNVVQFVS